MKSLLNVWSAPSKRFDTAKIARANCPVQYPVSLDEGFDWVRLKFQERMKTFAPDVKLHAQIDRIATDQGGAGNALTEAELAAIKISLPIPVLGGPSVDGKGQLILGQSGFAALGELAIGLSCALLVIDNLATRNPVVRTGDILCR